MTQFLCGYKGRPPLNLSKAEKKAIRNFALFLKGKGSRCVECCHKVTKHWTTCTAKGCDCRFSSGDVLATRAQALAPGWQHDPQ